MSYPSHSKPIGDLKPLKFKNPKDLLLSVSQVVKNRTGSVLNSTCILKSDNFETGIVPQLDIHLQGIKTILTLLQCDPASPTEALWISVREEPLIYLNRKPFVIRDLKTPLKNITTYNGIETSRLEQMECRLKADILRERHRWNGLVLVHEERSDGQVVPNWLSIDHIQTPREVFDTLRQEGFKVIYERIPISPEQAPTDRYIDIFLTKITKLSLSVPLIFNCGMGLGRTTCSMVIAMLIRRTQIILHDNVDPLAAMTTSAPSSMIELVHFLEEAFVGTGMGSAVEWARARTPVLEDLRDAKEGKYRGVVRLASMLVQGAKSRMVLDECIDRCSILVNLRESILTHRIRFSLTDDKSHLEKAVGCFERYCFLLALCSFLQETAGDVKFSGWLQARPDVWNVLKRIRGTTPALSLFRPCEDLSLFSSDIDQQGLSAWGPRSNHPATELDKYVIKARQGQVLVQNTILKEDFWFKPKYDPTRIKGASHFRKIPGVNIYAVAQPTLQGLNTVLTTLYQNTHTVIWINLREEPFVYINGTPYVLRDTSGTLRNITSFNGIRDESLEILERRLKTDVVSEIAQYDGKILVHSENKGAIVPGWEECGDVNVMSLREAMELVRSEMTDDVEGSARFQLFYHRVPQTAETIPEATDLDSMIGILKDIDFGVCSVVMNCQVGIGRSTIGSVVATLIVEWLGGEKCESEAVSSRYLNYQVIHSLLRVIRNGIECKRRVDLVIDRCAKYSNVRDMIEESRQLYETELTNVALKASYLKRGIVLSSDWIRSIRVREILLVGAVPKNWVLIHPEFNTILDEIHKPTSSSNPLIPVNEIEPGDGIALTNEVISVVSRRRGAVVSQGTIVKFDLFPGAQKLSLNDRIEGALNYRKVQFSSLPNLGLSMSSLSFNSSVTNSQTQLTTDMLTTETPPHVSCHMESVVGVGMPTKTGIIAVLDRLRSEGGQKVFWTSLREEPVLYIKGRPYVLRLFADPIKNLITTGITQTRVEEIEVQMKKDLLLDMANYASRLLLHEEKAEKSTYLVIPVWETLTESDIETPLEVYDSIRERGYDLDYLRIPITDELSPIPEVFDLLVDRILSIPIDCDPVFNCQMGRGRTTQGLVITYLMKMIVGNRLHEEVESPSRSYADMSVEKGYKMGNYNLILQLIAVLQFGKLSKRLVDLAIDGCEHMQNLREAIYDFRVRVVALGDKATFEVGYYLIEEWSVLGEGELKFCEWLESRREIINIIKEPNLD